MRIQTRRLFVTVAIAVGLVLLGSGRSASQDRELDRIANDMYGSIMSPFCPGRTLASCPSPQAAQLRDAIKTRLAAGESRGAIEESLLQTYGEIVLAKPRARGFGLLAWVVPVLFFGAGVWIMLRWLRGTRREPALASTDAPALNRNEQERLAAELAKL